MACSNGYFSKFKALVKQSVKSMNCKTILSADMVACGRMNHYKCELYNFFTKRWKEVAEYPDDTELYSR